MMNALIKEAIESAVLSEQQTHELSSKLLAWMQSLTDGNEDITNQSSFNQRCSLCFDHTMVSINEEE